jgi:hypothetical protein
MNKEIITYIINVFVVVVIIFGIITFINVYDVKLENTNINKQLKEVVTIESMENLNTNLDVNQFSAFCKSHTGYSDKLDISCGKLTNTNCNLVDCCVLLTSDGNQKCVAGDYSGPTYKTTTNGKNINIDYYYYKNKFYTNQKKR